MKIYLWFSLIMKFLGRILYPRVVFIFPKTENFNRLGSLNGMGFFLKVIPLIGTWRSP